MDAGSSPASRPKRLSLALALILHALVFLSFLAAAAVVPARADTVACTGRDIVAELERDDPAKLAALRAEAAETANGTGLLWRVEAPGVPASFLFGTMHVTDPRVTSLGTAAKAAFDAAGTLVIETTDVLDQAKMMAALASDPGLTMFTDGTTLTSLLPPADAAALEKGLEARGIPPGSVAKMKPWVLASVLSLPACELARKAEGKPMLDVKLAEEAKAAGKPVKGLETAVDQLKAMASLPLEFHLRGLVDTLKLGSRLDDIIETMIVLYENQETGLYWPLFRAELPESDAGGYAEFEETMITERNRGMAARAAPILRRGGAFVAVGALHLPGQEGLVALLRQQGFTVSRVE